MDKLITTLNRLPQFYNREDTSSIIYNVVKAFVDEINVMHSDNTRVDNMLGVDTTNGVDLEYRWGKLLMLPRKNNESDDAYRSRLKLSITSLSGGTADAIQYSIAVGLNINNDPSAMARIHIYDAWNYIPGGVPTAYGNIVCDIDLNNMRFDASMEQIVIDSANSVKASGTQITLIFSNYRVETYTELDNLTYISLDNIRYNQIGE